VIRCANPARSKSLSPCRYGAQKPPPRSSCSILVPHGLLVARDVPDLRTDVAVQADEFQRRLLDHAQDRLQGGAGREREAELLVLDAGRDLGVRVGVDAGRHPDHDLLAVRRQRAQLRDLVERVDDDPGDPVLQRGFQVLGGLHVAVHDDPLRREARGLGQREFPRRGHVEGQAFLRHPPVDLGAGQRLAREHDLRPRQGAPEGLRPGSDRPFVQDLARGAEPGRQLRGRESTDDQVLAGETRAVRPETVFQHRFGGASDAGQQLGECHASSTRLAEVRAQIPDETLTRVAATLTRS
jgi:hypothetical protein